MLLVLRHGETSWNVPPKRCQGQLDIPLNDAGRAAALELGASLPLPHAAYSSHLLRATETARCLLAAASKRKQASPPPLLIDRRLAETHFGAYQGMLHQEIQRLAPATWARLVRADLEVSFPDGERLGEVLERFSTALAAIEARHPDELALVVTHGGPMRLFLSQRELATTAPGSPPKNLQGFLIDGGELELFLPGEGHLHLDRLVARWDGEPPRSDLP